MNDPRPIPLSEQLALQRCALQKHKQSAHDRARESELTEALADNANARSGPGAYEPIMREYTARCGCYAQRTGEPWRWEWDSGACKGLIETHFNVMWHATREGYDIGAPIGTGKTEAEAIADLLEIEAMREDA